MSKNAWRTLVDIAISALLLAAGILDFLAAPARGILLAGLFAGLVLHLFLNWKKLLHPAARHTKPGAPARRRWMDWVRAAVYFIFLVSGLMQVLHVGAPAIPVIHRVAWFAALALTALHVLRHRVFLQKAWRNVIKRRPLPVLCTLLLCALLIALSALAGRSGAADPSPSPYRTPKPLPTATPTDDGAFHG